MPHSLSSAIYHLLFFSDLLVIQYESLEALTNSEKKTQVDVLYPSGYANCMLTIFSFLDEYDHFFVSEETVAAARIKQLKRILQPAIDEIRQFKDLVKFRNHMMSHHFRDRENGYQSLLVQDRLLKYELPHTESALLILVKCISFAGQIIERYFKKQYQDFKEDSIVPFMNLQKDLSPTDTNNYCTAIYIKIETDLIDFE